ncbi:MAG: hypothetical protein K2W95_25110 [Candidatus Obscuribacterales bacterium]|nr:hypothetical protein [Candidatus Obscuribacterales bacterium]
MTSSSTGIPTKSADGTDSSIGRFISAAEPGTVFTTRELLVYGSRTAVDKSLSRRCARTEIFRLSLGVYLKPKIGDQDWRPGAQEVVEAKLGAFRKIAIPAAAAETLATRIAPLQQVKGNNSNDEIRLDTNGATSSFRLYNGQTVRLKRISMRKFDLAQSDVGRVTRVLWEIADTTNLQENIRLLSQSLGREERKDVKLLLPLMPSWLSNALGAPWAHKWEAHSFPGPAESKNPAMWFSTSTISHSRALR